MKLNERDKIAYLANVIFVANADGSPSPKKSAVLEEIRSAIGAKKGAFDSATKLARSTGFTLTKLDTFVAEASNIADIIYVSIVDGGLSEQEKKIISEVAKLSSLTDQQFVLLTREAIARTQSRESSITCPACKAEITGDPSFCPKCGAALNSTAAFEHREVPKEGYVIEFCESTSADFPAALRIAQTSPFFASSLRNKKTWYMAAWPREAFEEAIKLAELLSGLRNRRCYSDGSEVEWDELFGFVWCAEQRTRAYRPTEYCFGKDENRLNPWGCKQARLEWNEWARWFSYGRFERAGILRTIVWVFDKARIRHELMTNLHRFRFCPHIRPKLIDAVLLALPDRVEVTNKGPWKYGQSHEEVPGSIKIVEKTKSDGFEFTNEFYADGVRPKGLGQIEEILRRAFLEAGITDINLMELTR
jgi:hypothetical protein